MEHTCESCTRRFFVPGAGVQEVACPSCGGHMAPERDQPSGTNSDGELRNMVDPYTGVDAGGDPSTEGILAPSIAGEHTQPLRKRDESFASIRTAAQQGSETPQLPVGIHTGTLKALQFCGATVNGMAPTSDLVRWCSKNWVAEARAGNPQPVTVSVESDHPAYLAAALGVVRVSSECNGNRTVPSPEFKQLFAGIKSGEVPKPTWLAQYSRESKVADADDFMEGFEFPDDDEDGPQSAHKFIVDNAGTVYSLPEPTHHETIAQNSGLDMSNFPMGLSLGVLLDNGVTEWYQHQSGLQPQQMAKGLEQHFNTKITIDPSLKPSSSEERFGIQPGAQGRGRGENQIAQDPPMPRSWGMPLDRNEGLVRGGGLDQSIYMPYEHLAVEKESILPLLVPAAMAATRVGGPLIAKKLAPKLMGGAMKPSAGPVSGALKTLGVHSLFKGVMGGGGGGGSAPAPAEQQAVAPTLQQVTHVVADTETPTSLPALHENDGDTHQFKDEGDSTNPEHPNSEEGGGSMSPAGALLDHLMPKVLEYYDSDESGEHDPLMKALDALMEQENPGYKDGDNDDHSDLEQFFTDLVGEHKQAAAFAPGMGMTMPAQQPMPAAIPPRQNPPTGPLPAQAACPSCGSLLDPNGQCAQCGFGAQGTATPGQVNQAVTPGTSPGGPPSIPPVMGKVADTQGPYTPEQFKAVAEALLQMGRESEIPHMYDAPWEYADILAQVQNKLNEPPPAVAEPAAPPGPPGMGDMMDPAAGGGEPPMDPAMMTASIAAVTARYASDNIAPKCPKCDSHTTGINATEDGSECRCHNCGNTWSENDITLKADVAEHPHDQPILDHGTGVDETLDSPHPDADSNLTWTTPDGQALTPGQEYEMHSQNYSIPDVIRVEEAKPGELVYTITGEYSELEDRTTITPEEVKAQGITFIPVGGDGQPVEELDVTEPTPASRVPITTNVLAADQNINVELADGRTVQAKLIGGRLIIPKTAWKTVEDNWKIADPGDVVDGATVVEVDNLTHHLDDGRILPADEVHPDNVHDFGPTPSKEASWLLEGTNVSAAPAPWETPLPDLTGGDMVQEDDGSWLMEGLPKTAGARFSPGEQRKFIDEDGEARNLDRLDLTDTHYKTRDGSVFVAGRSEMRFAQPDMAPDDHLVFGL